MSKPAWKPCSGTWTALSPILPIIITTPGGRYLRSGEYHLARRTSCSTFGRRADTIIKFALGDKISPKELEEITERKQLIYRRNVAQNIMPLPGAVALIKSLNQNHIKTAIASSAVQANIDVILQGLGIAKDFQAIVPGTEVAEGKPSPLVFQLAAKKLGVKPG